MKMMSILFNHHDGGGHDHNNGVSLTSYTTALKQQLLTLKEISFLCNKKVFLHYTGTQNYRICGSDQGQNYLLLNFFVCSILKTNLFESQKGGNRLNLNYTSLLQNRHKSTLPNRVPALS